MGELLGVFCEYFGENWPTITASHCIQIVFNYGCIIKLNWTDCKFTIHVKLYIILQSSFMQCLQKSHISCLIFKIYFHKNENPFWLAIFRCEYLWLLLTWCKIIIMGNHYQNFNQFMTLLIIINNIFEAIYVKYCSPISHWPDHKMSGMISKSFLSFCSHFQK